MTVSKPTPKPVTEPDIHKELMKTKNNQNSEDDPRRTRLTLIQRVAHQHDEKSWEDFVNIYSNYTYAIIRSMGISENDAQDINQQLLLTMWNKLPQTDIDKLVHFRAWLSTITKRLVIDFIRKRTSEAKRLEKAGQDETLGYIKAIRLPEIDPIAEREWKLHITNLALERIQPFFSGQAIEVFRLTLEGTSAHEIAEKLNIQENSVRRLNSRVKKKLLIQIEELRNTLE